MDNHEILKQLSSIECDLFYAIDDGRTNGIDPKALDNFRDKICELLEEWHELTGETL